MAAEQYIGNGNGFIYITENVTTPTNSNIITNVPNTCEGVSDIVYPLALSSSNLYVNKSATSVIDIVSLAGTGNVTAITINGINQIPAPRNVSGFTQKKLAEKLASDINSYTPAGNDYQAVAIGSTVNIIAPQSAGSTVNGLSVTVSNDDPVDRDWETIYITC